MADALNNLSDASSNVVSLVGFRLAAKGPDEKHPYGHARYAVSYTHLDGRPRLSAAATRLEAVAESLSSLAETVNEEIGRAHV